VETMSEIDRARIARVSPPSRHCVVIGGGITGTLSAVRLLRSGWRVTLLEAEHIGAGSSSRTAAGIRQQFSTPETVLGMRYAVDAYRRFPEEIGGLSVPIVENGYLFLLRDGLEAAAGRVAMQHSCGLREVELLSPGETALRFPFVDPDSLVGATWCPTDGFLRPEVVYGEAAASARSRGARILTHAPVSAARHEGGRLKAVFARGEWHEADLFVDATNAWSPRLSRVLGATELPISPMKRYLWFLRRPAEFSGELLTRMPMVVSPEGAYCHPENAETLMTGWAHPAQPEAEFTHEDQDRIAPEFSHEGQVEGRAFDTWQVLANLMPQIGEFSGFCATTSGYYGVTPDHNPFLAFDPNLGGLIRAAGFSGHGAMFGPFSAHVVERLAEAGHDLEDVEVLGERASLAPFRIGRDLHAAEDLVI